MHRVPFGALPGVRPAAFRLPVRVLFLLLCALSFVGVTPVAAAGCTPSAPTVTIDNTYAWGSTGSWGLPGQQLMYSIVIRNYDVGCTASNFVVRAYVTSPTGIADGGYPLIATIDRAPTPTSNTATYTSYYKVYSSDTTAPTLFWPNPGDGNTITGRSYNFMVSANDDHEVRKIDLYIDGGYRSTVNCDDIAYNCTLSYQASLRGMKGQHTATFKSYDWMGNSGSLTVTFTVS